ncbi:methylisocitrate lyase [Alicyclobacillus mengziensis]|uniref:Methylisocitrate lyase n=1 Tax=Alicyclobacillus mengziensis TaxID=2931921 RepID=A0A9X7VYC6_9BACL|nr:methylisocitrate lyase [Alicyclobacillus mengziensis]QSO47092.1 methylisocitrate lyase [Alicyclobacillus mengziensis]
MAWLVEQQPSQRELATSFLKQVQGSGTLVIPGAYDGLSALLARQTGFDALYLSGAALTASRGWPDLGLLTAGDIAERLRDVVRAANLPVLVDIDTGFGGVLNVIRTAREMVEASAAAVQIEDQVLPKKCGHLSGKQLISTEEMAQKVHALKQSAPSLVVVARTDAVAVEGFDAAIARARAYVEAGADVIFPEALRTEEQFRAFREAVSIPLLANMTEFGQTPYISVSEFEAWGYNAVIFPVTALRAAAQAAEAVYRQLKANGTQKEFLHQLQTRQELYDTLGYFDYERLDKSIEKSILPQNPGSVD